MAEGPFSIDDLLKKEEFVKMLTDTGELTQDEVELAYGKVQKSFLMFFLLEIFKSLPTLEQSSLVGNFDVDDAKTWPGFIEKAWKYVSENHAKLDTTKATQKAVEMTRESFIQSLSVSEKKE